MSNEVFSKYQGLFFSRFACLKNSNILILNSINILWLIWNSTAAEIYTFGEENDITSFDYISQQIKYGLYFSLFFHTICENQVLVEVHVEYVADNSPYDWTFTSKV